MTSIFIHCSTVYTCVLDTKEHYFVSLCPFHLHVVYHSCLSPMVAHIANIFDRQFDYVVNLCGETRFGVPETEYPAKCVVPCTKVVAACTHLQSVKKFVEVSTAQVYDSDKKPSKEGDKVKPWTNLAKARLEAEEIVKKSSLPYVILRPATVYGPADLFGLMPRICCAAVYQKLKEPMKLLWTAELKTNTVHVDDVCSAIVHVRQSNHHMLQYTIYDVSGFLIPPQSAPLHVSEHQSSIFFAFWRLCLFLFFFSFFPFPAVLPPVPGHVELTLRQPVQRCGQRQHGPGQDQ